MNSTNRFFVLGASRYDFTTRDGQTMKGCKIRYIPNAQETDDNNVGMKHIELNAPYEVFQMFTQGTGIYDLSFEMVPGNGGSIKMKIVDARLVKKVDLFDFIEQQTRKAS